MRRALLLLPLFLLGLAMASDAQWVPLQVYGQLPHLEDMALSPDGSQIAFVRTEGNARIVSVQVDLVTLKHEDHWLSRSETRLQMLQASVEFLRANNPPDQAASLSSRSSPCRRESAR